MKLHLDYVILDTTKLVETMKKRDLDYLKSYEKQMKEKLAELQKDLDSIHTEIYEREWRLDAIQSSAEYNQDPQAFKKKIEDIKYGIY